MCNCSLQLLSINIHNDLLISFLLLFPSLSPVDWMHGGHRNDAEIQEAPVWKGWVNAKSSHSMSVLFPSVGDVWARTVCRRRTWTLLCSRGLCFTVTHRRMTTGSSCKCSQTAAARSVWKHHSLPVDIFLLLNYGTAWLQEANKKRCQPCLFFLVLFFSVNFNLLLRLVSSGYLFTRFSSFNFDFWLNYRFHIIH